MAVTSTDHRTLINAGTSVTGWSTAPTANTADPDPLAGGAADLGIQVSTATVNSYVTITAVNMNTGTNPGHIIYFWMIDRAALDTIANVGNGIVIGDGTNRAGYGLAGKDATAFRFNETTPNWRCEVLDIANLPSAVGTVSGTPASINKGAITNVGVYWKTLAKSVGGALNCFWQTSWYLDPNSTDANGSGCACSITGGTSGTPGVFDDIYQNDKTSAYGIVRKVETGVYGCQGPIRFGNQSGTSSSYFADKNTSFVFEARNFTTNKYKIYIIDANSTGTTNFTLGTKVGSGASATGTDGCSLIVPSGVGALFDSYTSTHVGKTVMGIYGSTMSGFTNGITIQSDHEIISTTISGSGEVTTHGARMVSSKVLSSTVAADAYALRWSITTETDGYLDNMTFSKGTNAHHAIGFTNTTASTYTLRNIAFGSGFNAANSNNDSTFYVAATTGTVTINVIGCSGNITYKSAGATVSIVSNPVTLAIHVQDINTGSALVGARVYTPVTSSASGRPYNQTINSITRSGSTATVTFAAAHNLATNDYLKISGCNQPEYNQAFQVTVTGTTTLTVTVSGTPASGSGTMVGTWVIISGVTDGSGNISASYTYSASQPISGWVRLASSAPYYKTGAISGTVSSTTGLSVTVQMIPDS